MPKKRTGHLLMLGSAGWDAGYRRPLAQIVAKEQVRAGPLATLTVNEKPPFPGVL